MPKHKHPAVTRVQPSMVEDNATWNGSPVLLAVNSGISMPSTPNGSTLFVAANQSTINSAGQLGLSSGSSLQFLDVPALINTPTLLANNWQANNLNVTNTSSTPVTIYVAMFGPGIGPSTPLSLQIGTPVQLATGVTAQGVTQSRNMLLKFSNTTGSLALFFIIGGPLKPDGTNSYTLALNASADTGPGYAPPPAGYFATTTSNAYSFPFNWQGATVFVAGMSPITSLGATVTLIGL